MAAAAAAAAIEFTWWAPSMLDVARRGRRPQGRWVVLNLGGGGGAR